MVSDHATKSPCYLFFTLFYLLILSGSSFSRADHVSTKCIDKEREALLKLKKSIKVDRCGLLYSWGNRENNSDCCRWSGVHCSNHTGNVIMLDLHGVNTSSSSLSEPCLEGNISPYLNELKHLGYLDLSYNDFRGQAIPSFIGSLSKLKHLNLSNAGFHGEVPHQLGNLSDLQSLHLSCDSLYPYCQHVETLEWLSHLHSLRHIDISHIDLSNANNWAQIINQLPFLTFLRMNTCKLPPAIPHSSNSLMSLRALDLENNNLNSSIYQWLFNSSEISTPLLEIISLRQNQLEGPIPDSLGISLPTLRYLDLSDNQITCPIPDTVGNLKHLAYLALSKNKLQGCTLPKTFGDLCSLRSLLLAQTSLSEELSSFFRRLCAQKSLMVLDLSGNQLWGSIPDSIDHLFPSLRVFYVDNNQLNGTISKSIEKLSELERLSMSSNLVKDNLSDLHFEKLSRLQHLDLSNNSLLVLNFSSGWVPPFQLDTIRLRSCKLGPHFPRWLRSQGSFSYLDISDAGISEPIPTSFWELLPTSKLSYLNMSRNKIPGIIPDISITFDHLRPPDMDLSSNSFEGTIPSFLGNVSSLSLSYNNFSNPIPLLCPNSRLVLFDVDLSNNFLTGELPADCWVNADQLSFINLEINRFSGKLPASLGALKHLQSFRLCDNFFSGDLPVSLKNCNSLVILDIGDNRFTGHIPPVIGDSLQSLVVLNLRRNKFLGSIPLSLCKLSDLQILDLSGNHISGIIPKCIRKFTAMTNKTDFLIHLPSNSSDKRFRYPYAAWVKWKRVQQKFGDSLGLVKSFDVSDNELEGKIPPEISFLAGLVSMDLSRNKLTGSITPTIGQLTNLEMLDLSSNHLCGKIPQSLANLSYLGILDLSNNNLTGRIPTGTQLQGFDVSAYKGNPELCGAPLLKKCPRDQVVPTTAPPDGDTAQQKDGTDDVFPGLYICLVVGFVIGFCGVCGTLVLINKLLGHDYLQFADTIIRAWRKH